MTTEAYDTPLVCTVFMALGLTDLEGLPSGG